MVAQLRVHLSVLNTSFGTAFLSNAVRPLWAVLAILPSQTWQLPAGCLMPMQCCAPSCSLPQTGCSPRQDRLLSQWVESTFLPKAAVHCLHTPQKNFPLQVPRAQGWIWLFLALSHQQVSSAHSNAHLLLSRSIPSLAHHAAHRCTRETEIYWIKADWGALLSLEPLRYKAQKHHPETTRYQHAEQTHSQHPQPPHPGLQLQLVLPLVRAWKKPTLVKLIL